jgi:lipoprotein-anchoring transpeptidase ErfK/SrfK
MSGGAPALGMSDRQYRRASLALGVAATVTAVSALITATAGPDAVDSALPDVAPPKPAAQVTIAQAVNTPSHPATPINPTDPITVSVAHGTLRAVTVTDSKSGKPVEGLLDAGGTSWHSTGQLSYDDSYQLVATAIGENGELVRQTGTVTTLDPERTAYPSFIPAPTTSTVGVGQPLVVEFDHPIADKAAAEKALEVTTSPEQVGAWYWISPTEVHYRPQTYWQPGTTITLTAHTFGVDLGKGTFGQSNRTETIHVHDSWIAKANGATEQMDIFHNGDLVKTMPISLGSPGHPSHSGPHVISDKQPSIIMDSCSYGVCKGQPGYYREKVNLDLRISNDGEFVHSAPWSVGQQGDSNVSHGCVNLSPANARWFYNHFSIGDVVEISNSGGPPLPIWDRYGDWELDWTKWQSGSALRQ